MADLPNLWVSLQVCGFIAVASLVKPPGSLSEPKVRSPFAASGKKERCAAWTQEQEEEEEPVRGSSTFEPEAEASVIRETHPDVNPSADAAERWDDVGRGATWCDVALHGTSARFIQAQEAFRWLSDPQQREVYVPR
eukprot:Skav201845  [mRNA]  locus=scaffold484:295662:297658:- [translate_table: standard]